MKYINPHEFYLETNGKKIDVDGAYGGQCWDLFAYFCQKYCGRTFSCISTGYVIDLWTHFEQCGLNQYFDKVYDYHALQDGDWLIWDKNASPNCWISNKSHIAMFREYNPSNIEQNVILTQNPNGIPNYVHQMICDFHGFVGALRPKTNVVKKIVVSDPVEENKDVNQVYITCDNTMRCRTTAEINNDNCIGFYITGFYNVLEEKNTDYHWCKVAENNWVAILDGYANYIPKYIEPIIENKPVQEEKEQASPIPQEEPITLENGQEEQKIEDNSIDIINKDKKNPLIEFIKWIFNMIAKFKEGGKQLWK